MHRDGIPLPDLIDLLAVERIEGDRFRGRSEQFWWGYVFGGQFVGQALSAASADGRRGSAGAFAARVFSAQG
jgi:acyl-CoA thioesterase